MSLRFSCHCFRQLVGCAHSYSNTAYTFLGGISFRISCYCCLKSEQEAKGDALHARCLWEQKIRHFNATSHVQFLMAQVFTFPDLFDDLQLLRLLDLSERDGYHVFMLSELAS